MQLKFTQALAAMRHAQHYLDANGTALGDFNAGGARKAFDDVTALLGALSERQGAHQMRASGELANEQVLARDLRRKHIVPIVRVARALLPEVARLEAVRVPPFRSNNTELTSKARSLADAVEPHTQGLKAGGLAPDFVVALRRAANELDAAIASKVTHRRERVGATDAIVKVVRQARRATNAADALVRARLGVREPLITEWRTIVRAIRTSATQAMPVAGEPGTEGGATPEPTSPSTLSTPAPEAPAKHVA